MRKRRHLALGRIEHRIAIGLRLRDGLGGDDAGRTGLVVDDHLLADFLR